MEKVEVHSDMKELPEEAIKGLIKALEDVKEGRYIIITKGEK